MSFAQPVEEKSMEQGGFNQEEIEKIRALLGPLEKPSSTCSLALSGKFPISIRLKASDKAFVKSWVIDSSATDHMTTHSLQQFKNYNPCPRSRKIVIADGSLTTIALVGDVQISPTLTLKNVLHVPKLSTNRVPIQKLTRDLSCIVTFFPTYCVFQD